MKYLKRFEDIKEGYRFALVESPEKQESLDILQELVDDGFSVDVQHRVNKIGSESIGEEIIATVYNMKTFQYKSIEEYMLRLADSLKEHGFYLGGQSNPLVLKNVASVNIPHSAYYHIINFGKTTRL